MVILRWNALIIVRIELVGLGVIVAAIVESQLNTGHSTEKMITFTIYTIDIYPEHPRHSRPNVTTLVRIILDIHSTRGASSLTVPMKRRLRFS